MFHLTGPRAWWDDHSWLPEPASRNGYNIESYVPHIAESDVYICGPASWARNVIADARAAGVGPEQIRHERFDW